MLSTEQEKGEMLSWDVILSSIKNEIPERNFNTWFSGTHITEIQNETVIIGVPNEFTKTWIQNKYVAIIIQNIRSHRDDIRNIKLVVSKKQKKEEKKIPLGDAKINHELDMNSVQIDVGRNLNKAYTFDTLITTDENTLVKAAADTLLRKLGSAYNPFFVHGNTGVGKTHLLQAIGNKAAELYPQIKIFFFTSEMFTSNYLKAVQNESVQKLRDSYKNYDLVLIDDVQFFTGKKKTMEEVFHLFNIMYEKNKQIVFSADQPPGTIEDIEPRLRSRFNSGATFHMAEPEKESKIIILEKKLHEKGVDIKLESMEYIVENFHGSIREIDGIVSTIALHKETRQMEINEQTIKDILKTQLIKAHTFSSQDIIKKVCSYYGTEVQQVSSNVRKRDIVLARQVIMYFLREYLDLPFTTIGSRLGGKDHTTVIHSCDKIKNMMKENQSLKSDVDKIKKNLGF